MRRHARDRIAVVNLGLENLYILPGNLGTAHAANQLLGFAAEHTAADQFDPTPFGLHEGHDLSPLSMPNFLCHK